MQKYQDSSLSPEERASDLLARMNLDEKFGQIQCYNAIDSFLGKSVEKQNPYGVGQVCILIATMLDDVGSVAGLITRLQKQIMASGKHHIPAIFHIETLTGVMVTAATSFPCGLGQASTWDPEQQQKMAACIARQGRAMGISHALAPVFDICRDPRFGRMGETYGEDPTLAAAMGTAYVKGLQDKHRMSACSKHFLGFMAGQGGIHTAQAVASPRELREVYAKPFQAAITEGKLDSVMNSYAAIDGQVPAGSKAILRDLLRSEMGFNGVTVSDYSAVEQLESTYHLAESPADAGRLALEAGMDQELPTIAAYNDELKENIRSGVVQGSLLDEAVLRILTMKFRLGLFENPFPAENVQAEITPADTALNRKIAQESMILLKNDGVLPLAKSAKKVAVIGWHADSVRALFGGYSALAMKENTLGVKMSMAGIQADADSPVAENAVQKTYPGSEVVMENPGIEPLARRCYPDAYSMLGALRLAAPHTEFLYAQGYPYWYRMKSPNSPYNRYFMQDFKVDTAAMVQDAYNHPSVVIYSIGNEIPEAGGVKGVRVGKEIVDAIHALDTTRPTTLCPSVHWLREYLDGTPYLTTDEDEWMRDDPERQKANWMHYASIFRSAVNNLPDNEKGQVYPETYIRMDEDATKNLYPYLDIAGYNYYEDRYEVLHKLHPERVLLGTETRHTMLPDTMKFAKTHPYLIGDFVWTLQSHLGEINCCDLHYEENEEHKSYPWVTNHGGVLDLTGQAEPSLHRYEFIWGGFLDKPVHALYLASQPPVHNGKPPITTSYRWTDTVDGWTYEGYEGKRTFVDAYTDADSVEIFVNGKSAGKAQVKDYFAKIPCIYEPGELVGVGYDADGQEIYRTSVRTADAETMLTVKTDKNILRAGGQDFCFADVYVTDKNGTVKLLPDYDVKIEVVGAASLQGYGSAAYKNAEHYDQHHHKSWQGHLQAVLRSTEKTGPVTVTFTADGCAPTILHLSAE